MGSSGSKQEGGSRRAAERPSRATAARPSAPPPPPRSHTSERQQALARARRAQAEAEAAAAVAIRQPILTELAPHADNVQLPPEPPIEEWLALDGGRFERDAHGCVELWLVREAKPNFGLEVAPDNTVKLVADGSAASRAGLRAGDVVVAVSTGGASFAGAEFQLQLSCAADPSKPPSLRLAEAVLELYRMARGPLDVLALTVRRAARSGAGPVHGDTMIQPPVTPSETPESTESYATEDGFAEAEAKALASAASFEQASATGTLGALAWVAARLPDASRWVPQLIEVNQYGITFYAHKSHRAAGAIYAQVPLPLLLHIHHDANDRSMMLSLRTHPSPARLRLVFVSQKSQQEFERAVSAATVGARATAIALLADVDASLARARVSGEGTIVTAAASRRRSRAAAAVLSRTPAHGHWWRGEPLRQLWGAAASGDVGTVRSLVAQGVPLDAQRPTDGKSASMLAANGGHVAALGVLVDAGADLDAVCCRGRSAMHYACLAAEASMADPNRTGSAGSAAVAGYAEPSADAINAGAAVLLAVNGASLDTADAQGVTPVASVKPECGAALGQQLAMAMAAAAERMAVAEIEFTGRDTGVAPSDPRIATRCNALL